MEDQVQRLKQLNIPAAAIRTGMTWQESTSVLEACTNDELKFLYVSPERLETRAFRERLRHLPINLLAIDESHCISQWGYDFRPAYLHIAKVRETFPSIPILALTASATPEVQKDIILQLKMHNPLKFTTSFTRKNLIYEVIPCVNKIGTLIKNLESISGSGIVYCKSRRRTKEISELLQQQGIPSNYYHAGLDQDTRKARQESWISGETKIIACTNAFGMGIDKPDVRVVIHADVPDCLENYYQEAGRAGRDGEAAKAILLYNDRELAELQLQPDIRYPNMQTIRKVYQALANFLQVPTGGGVNISFDFDLETFMSRFKLNLYDVLYSLQALRQEQIISYLENVFLPSTVQFNTGRAYIEEIEASFPAYEPLIKALLRSYAGILDQPVRISEQQLGKRLFKDVDFIRKGLNFLHGTGLIVYSPSKDQPQISFLHGRIQTDELNVNHANYLKRKAAYKARIEQMTGYISNQECRSVYIGAYFGDEGIAPCGICDFCRKKSQNEPGYAEMKYFMDAIKMQVINPIDFNSLQSALQAEPDYLKKTLLFMKGEGIIGIDTLGKITLK
jgi:ATP-dependent DNA helicase RecQ